MNFQNMIRSGLLIAGLGAALSFPGWVSAQEITNARFSDGPNVVALAEPSVTAQSTVANSNALPGPQVVQASTASAAEALPQQPTSDEQEPNEGLMWAGVALVWIGAIGIYACGPAKRLTEQIRSLRNSLVSTRSA
jgi:hypothetical protein